MRTNFIISIVISAFVLGLNSSANAQANQQKDHHAQQKNESIKLNKGAKWKVDEKMLSYLLNMEKDIQSYESSGNKDYKKLAGKLKENLNAFINSCSLSGKAHDELHKWLVPYIGQVNELTTTQNEKSSKEIIQNIKISFEDFHKYFE